IIKEYNLKEIPYNTLRNKKKLRSGGFGKVFKATSSSLGYVAIKELKQLNRSGHERVIKFHGISFTEGMSYLHDIDITHRDLVKHFGFSKYLKTEAITTSKEICGVIPFIDPRKLNDPKYPYDKKSDVYSMGVLLWEISSNGSVPFSSQGYDACLPFRIIRGSREERIIGTPVQYISLYSKCWDYEPNKRPSMPDILRQLNSLELDPKYDGTN
ncbi:17878_t:CDS:2, partial [Racocetra fulgida]